MYGFLEGAAAYAAGVLPRTFLDLRKSLTFHK